MKKKDPSVEQLSLADNLTKNIAKIRKKIEAIENEGEVAEPGYTLMRYLAGVTIILDKTGQAQDLSPQYKY